MIHRLRRIVRRISRWNVLRQTIAATGKKAIFGTGALLILLYNGYALFSTRHLKSERQRTTDAYVHIAGEHLLRNTSSTEVLDTFFNMIRVLELPVIITDTNWVPLRWDNFFQLRNTSVRRAEVQRLPLKKLDAVQKKVNLIRKQNKPYPLFVQDGKVKIGYLLIGNNLFLNILSFLPYFEILILCAFFAIAYVVFQVVRSTEKSNLWVGLAKETAHQLGTPISSLMGWTEYIRTIHEADPPIEPEVFMSQIRKICDDMDNDLIRLRKVTARFSQIGSIPALSVVDVNVLIQEVTEYYKMRLPLLRKHIDIKFELGDVPGVSANRDLTEWVLENVFKNSIDAIVRENGVIEIKTEYVKAEKIVRIIHRDNGKGMTRDVQHQIFSPGFTTKKRGWGLGLTLSKRIVEDYHNGRIYVSWSQKDKGTVFCIDLPMAGEQ